MMLDGRQETEKAHTTKLSVILTMRVKLFRDATVDFINRHCGLHVTASFDVISATALERIRRSRPSIVIFDASCVESTSNVIDVLALSPDSIVIAAGVSVEPACILKLARVGVSGYINDDATQHQWIESIFSAVRGELNNPRVAGILNRELHSRCSIDRPCNIVNEVSTTDDIATYSRNPSDGTISPGVDDLTRRQVQIMSLVNNGCSNKEIARELSLSVSTVKNHLHAVMSKYKVNRRIQAAQYFRRQTTR